MKAPPRSRSAALRTRLAHALRWQRLRKVVFVTALVLIGVRLALGIFLDSVLDGATQGTLGLACKIERSTFDAISGHVVLRNVSLVSRDGKTVASIGRAELELSWFDLPNLMVHRISIEDALVQLHRDKDRKIPALAAILERASQPPAKDPTTEDATKPSSPGGDTLPVVLLRRMRAHNVRVTWDDEAVTPAFHGEVVIDVRANDIATFDQPAPPSVSIRLAAPGILDEFQLEFAAKALASDTRSFELVLYADAKPGALAAYVGNDVRLCSKSLVLDAEARGSLSKTLIDRGSSYTGNVTVDRFSIKADEDEVSAGRIIALVRRLTPELLELSSISIDRPQLRFGRLRDGVFRVLGFGLTSRREASAESAPPAAASASDAGPHRQLIIDEFKIHDGGIAFRDETADRPVDIAVTDAIVSVRDLLVDRSGTGRSAQLEASLGLKDMAERIAIAGTFVPTGANRQLTLEVTGRDLRLDAIAPWLDRAGVASDLEHATFTMQLRADAAFHPDGTIGFGSELSKLQLFTRRGVARRELIGVDALRIEDGSFDPRHAKVDLGRIVVERPRGFVRRAPDGTIAAGGIRTLPPRPPVPVADATVAPTRSATPTAISIGRIGVRDGVLAWRDEALGASPLELSLDKGSLEAVGLRLNDPARPPASLRASGRLGPALGEIGVEGSLVADPAAPEVTASLTVSNLSFAPLKPYLSAAGMDALLERGRFELGLGARAKLAGGDVEEARVSIGPVALRSGLEELFALESLTVEGASRKGATTDLGTITITNVRGRAARNAAGALSAFGVRLRPRTPSAETPPLTEEPPPPGDLRWSRVALRGVSFAWHDDAVSPPADVRLARLDATLAENRLDRPTAAPLKVRAELERCAVIDLRGELVPSGRAPVLSADLQVRALTLASVAPYVSASGFSPALANGSIDAHLEYAGKTTGSVTETRADVTRFTWRDGKDELLGIDRATVAMEQDARARSLRVAEATIVKPRLAASRAPTGELRVLGLIARKADGEPANAPPPATGPATQVRIEKFRVSDASVRWNDEQADARVQVNGATIEAGPIAPSTKTTTPWRVTGDLGPLGALEMSGTAVLATRSTAVGAIKMTRVRGDGIGGYLGAGTNLRLDDGTISLAFDWASEPAAAGGQQQRAAIKGLAIVERGRTLLGWDALRVVAPRIDPAAHVFVVDELALEGLRGETEKLPNGASRSFGFHKVPVTAEIGAEAPEAHEPAPLPSFTLRKLSLGLANLIVRDRSTNAPEPQPFVVESLTIGNESPFVLSADDPTTAHLEIGLKTSVTRVLDSAVVRLDLAPFEAEPHARVAIELAGIHGPEIARRSPALAAKHDLARLIDGRAKVVLGFSLKSHHRLDALSANPAPLAFETTIESLEVRSSPDGPVTFGLDELRLEVSAYDRTTGEMRIKAIELSDPIVLLAKDKEGTRYLDILTRGEPAPANAPPSDAPAPAARPAAPIRIEKITLQDGEVSIVDGSVAPDVRAKMTSFEVEILGASADWKHERRPMKIQIRSRTGSIYDDIKFKTSSLSFAPRANGDFEARILGLKLNRISGYTESLYKLKLVDGRLDVETRGSFKNGKLTCVARVTLMSPQVEEPPEGCTLLQGAGISMKTALGLLKDQDDQVQLEVPLTLEFDEDLQLMKENQDFGIGAIIGQALGSALRGAVGPLLNAISSLTGNDEKKKTEEDKTQAPVPFAPADVHLPASVFAELDALAEKLKNEPLRYVSLRGELGTEEEPRIRLLACPPPADRRDLIARLEAERGQLDRTRADALAAVRAALQAGAADPGPERARLVDAQAALAKLDRALDPLYEQEREGGNRAAERRARELAADLCERRVEAVFAYLASKGAPIDRIKRRPHRVKGGDAPEGRVAIDSWVARRQSVDRQAVQTPSN